MMALDMSGLDLNLTYEDGLRLSELMGQRAEIMYSLDHIWAHSAPLSIILGICMFVIVFGIILLFDEFVYDMYPSSSTAVYEDTEKEAFDGYKRRRRFGYRSRMYTGSDYNGRYRCTRYEPIRGVRLALMFGIPLLAAVLVAVGVTELSGYFAEKDLIGVEAQIESILERYT